MLCVGWILSVSVPPIGVEAEWGNTCGFVLLDQVCYVNVCTHEFDTNLMGIL